MVAASARIEQRHSWDSYWYEWPINARGVLYYSRDVGSTQTESVYLLGNPLVVWPIFGFCIISLLLVVAYTRYRTDPLFYLTINPKYRLFFASTLYCCIVYALNMAPYIAVKRSCFM